MKLAFLKGPADMMSPSPKQLLEIKTALGEDSEVYVSDTGADLIEQGIHADIVAVFGSGNDFAQTVGYHQFNKQLKWIHSLSSGYDGISSCAALRNIPGLRVSNSRGVLAVPIAEHVMACLLSFTRRLASFRANMKDRHWAPCLLDELCGKTIGILGMGSIGTALAQRAKGFDMTVLGLKRTYADIPFVDRLFLSGQDDELISQSDILVLAMPESDATKGYMNMRRFRLMKPNALLVNVGRGSLVDHNALISALNANLIAGAVLDTTSPEPLPENSPLWSMENVLITPHVAGSGPNSKDRTINLLCRNIESFVKGSPLVTGVEW